MSRATVAVITGGNRGIGEAIVQSLATKPPQVPLILYATSRKGSKLDINPATDVEIRYSKLDVDDLNSIRKFHSDVVREHQLVDVLFNNGAVQLEHDYCEDSVHKTIETNFYGTLRMCQQFIPSMRQNGRIVNISSVGSSLNGWSSALQQRIKTPRMTLPELDTFVQEYLTCVDDDPTTEHRHGYPGNAYRVSKAFVNAATGILARNQPDVTMNCCCPGWVNTDMGRLVGSPTKSPMDGAKIPVRLAFADLGGISGKYWENSSVFSTGEGQVRER